MIFQRDFEHNCLIFFYLASYTHRRSPAPPQRKSPGACAAARRSKGRPGGYGFYAESRTEIRAVSYVYLFFFFIFFSTRMRGQSAVQLYRLKFLFDNQSFTPNSWMCFCCSPGCSYCAVVRRTAGVCEAVRPKRFVDQIFTRFCTTAQLYAHPGQRILKI